MLHAPAFRINSLTETLLSAIRKQMESQIALADTALCPCAGEAAEAGHSARHKADR